ncbi:hypothetical protein ElyMa_005248200 [Elysia marginata]|uniref:Uncharacterized protein n=1 Tax=Elysia marginata TaxID=1093978 RepID=A0AAV4JWT5_9GAST|nr:hypothetical protein ElyMa_005248200 [Elysia marginata]
MIAMTLVVTTITVVSTPMMTVVTTPMMTMVTTPIMTVVTSPMMTMTAMIQVHRYVQIANQGCRNVRPSTADVWPKPRDHTHTGLSLSGHSHCRLTASQYRSRQTARFVKYQRRQGFFLTSSSRPSSDRLPGLFSSHRPLTQVTLSAKSKTLRGGETDPSPTPHLPVRCQSDGVST